MPFCHDRQARLRIEKTIIWLPTGSGDQRSIQIITNFNTLAPERAIRFVMFCTSQVDILRSIAGHQPMMQEPTLTNRKLVSLMVAPIPSRNCWKGLERHRERDIKQLNQQGVVDGSFDKELSMGLSTRRESSMGVSTGSDWSFENKR